LTPAHPYEAPAQGQRLKVFWFFFSKKNKFLSLDHNSPIGNAPASFRKKANAMSLRSASLALAPLAALIALPAFAADNNIFALSPAPANARLAPVADATKLRVILSLPLQNEASARRYGAAVSDPKNPLYGHYLTPDEFGARFGANAADYEALRSWAASVGLGVGPRLASRAELSLSGTAAQFAALFGTHFVSFPTARGDGYTVTSAPRLPAALQGRVNGVIGLTSQAKLGLLLRKPRVHADLGTGIQGSGLAPSDLATAYNVPAQTGGKTETVAIFEQDGYFSSDITTYTSSYGLPNLSNQAVSVNGSTTGVTGNGAELEADLDIDMLAAINPGIKSVLVYIDSQDSFQTALLDAINLVAQNNKATVFSISYGQDESLQGTSAIKAENTALVQLQTQGITVFVSAGDSGAAGDTGSGYHVADPGTQPLVTCVGGTDLELNSTTFKYAGERVWNDLAEDAGATGGGASSVWPIPTWQVVGGVSVAKANGGSSSHRNVPDIAAVADDVNSPVSVYSNDNGGWVAVGGTSVSAPVWAGWISIYNDDRVAGGKARLGFLNTKLYTLGEAETNFHDVKVGNNGSPGHKAGPGYDDTTGWGSINVKAALSSFTK
jgi:kumamolisin